MANDIIKQQKKEVKYLNRRLTWRKHIKMKRKVSLNVKFFKMCWLMRKNFKL